jgi:hypothetical protein
MALDIAAQGKHLTEAFSALAQWTELTEKLVSLRTEDIVMPGTDYAWRKEYFNPAQGGTNVDAPTRTYTFAEVQALWNTMGQVKTTYEGNLPTIAKLKRCQAG